MTVLVTLPPDVEARLQADADQERLPIAEVAARRLEEAELLRRIFSYFPAAETQEMRGLVRRRTMGTLSSEQAARFTELAQAREVKNAQRLADVLALARLRRVSHRQVMSELGIRPHRMG